MKNEASIKMHEIWQPADVSFSKPFDMRSLNRTPSWRREIASGQKELSDAVLSTQQKVFACPICGESTSCCFVVIYGFHYQECCQCHHLYCSNPPGIAAVKNLYTGNEDDAKKSIQTWTYLNKQNYETRIANIATPKVSFVGKFVQPAPGAQWIDVGSGAGETLVAAASAGWQAIGIECDPAECEFARDQGLVVVEEFVTESNVKLLLNGAKVVSVFNVIEHVEDPFNLLLSISDAMDCGSHIVIEVPRHPSISSLSNSLFPGMSCRHIVPPDHLHIFSDQSLQNLTSSIGIAPVGVWYFGQDYYDIISSAMASANIPTSSLYHASVDLAPLIQPIIDNAGLSDTMLFVGRKT